MQQKKYSICVFCGARDGNNPAYKTAAKALAAAIAGKGWRLINGGGNIGLMGACLRASIAAGGEVIGIIPRHLAKKERVKDAADTPDNMQLILTDDMATRKKLMLARADAAIILAGGTGTLDEFFEVLTWAQLGQYNKPIIIANIDEFWSPLLTLLDHVRANGFAHKNAHNFLTVCNSVDAIMAALSSHCADITPAAKATNRAPTQTKAAKTHKDAPL